MSSSNIHKKGFVPEPPQGCDLSKDRILLHCCCAPCSTAIIEWMVSQGLRPGIFFSNSNIVPFNEYTVRRDELRRYAAAHGLETIDDEYDHSAWLAFVRQLETRPKSGASMVAEPCRTTSSVTDVASDAAARPVAELVEAHQQAEAPQPFPVTELVEVSGSTSFTVEPYHPTEPPIRIADMPERGPRCLECFKFRLLRAARYASTHGYRLLTTTLASSRWKDLSQVDAAGRWACETVNGSSAPISLDSVPRVADISSIDTESSSEGYIPTADPLLSVAPLPESTEVLWWNQNWRRGGLQERRNALIKEWSMYNQTFCGCEFSERH